MSWTPRQVQKSAVSVRKWEDSRKYGNMLTLAPGVRTQCLSAAITDKPLVPSLRVLNADLTTR